MCLSFMLLPFPAHDVIPHLHDNVGQTDPQCCFQKAVTKTSEYAGEKAGNKIIQLLSKKNKKTPVAASPEATSPIEKSQSRELSDYEINERVNQLLCGGQMRRFIY